MQIHVVSSDKIKMRLTKDPAEKMVMLTFSMEEFEKLFEIRDTTEFDAEEYNVNGVIRVDARQFEKLIETILRRKYRYLIMQYSNLRVNLLDIDLPGGHLDYCVEDKDGDKNANQKAIRWWRQFDRTTL